MDELIQQGQNQNQTPQDAGQLALQEQGNPFDTSAQEQELGALQAELEQSVSAIDNDFAAYYAENMPEEVEELFFDDRVAFLLEVEKEKQRFVEEKIAPLKAKSDEIAQNIAEFKNAAAIWEAQSEFSKAHPEADLDEILKFYNDDLSPKQKQALESEGDLLKMYEKVYQYMTGGSQDETQKKKPEKKLPKQTNAQFGSIAGLDLDLNDSDLPINRR